MDRLDHKAIYESPDGGKTVFARPFGKPRDASQWNEVYESQTRQAKEHLLWQRILEARHGDADIAVLLDQARSLYLLRHGDGCN